MLNDLVRYLRHKRDTDPSFHLVGGEETGTDPDPDAEPAGYRRSVVVEGDGCFFTKTVPPFPEPGAGFTHFLDGIQRTRLIGYQGIVPLVYGFTAAVIRERREDRTLGVWREPVREERIYAPANEVDAGILSEFGLVLHDTSRLLTPGESSHPARYRQAALTAIQRDRAGAEARLAGQWVEESESHRGWLFVDGGLTFATQQARIAGIVKSHQTQYFPPEEQARLFRIGEGERSAVFQPGFGEARAGDVYSWYLRLHPFARRDLTFGLIRVEVDRRAEVISMADRISRWLMAERRPLSAPDARWDKMVYPIRDCEEYLRSIAPSHLLLEGILA